MAITTEDAKQASFYLANLRDLNDLKKLVIEEWNYYPARITQVPFSFSDEIISKIQTVEIIAEHSGFQIIYFQLDESAKNDNQSIDQFIRSTQKEIIKEIRLPEQRNNKLFVFTNTKGDYWHFVAAQSNGKGIQLKRFTVDPDNRNHLRTACEQLRKLQIDPAKEYTLQKLSIQLDDAFSVEEVSTQFFRDYKATFGWIKGKLSKQQKGIENAQKNAHRFTHLLLNRLMFLYFVQKKGCFASDGRQYKNFLITYWNAYQDNFEGQNRFYNEWLQVMFFEGLNKPYVPKNYFNNLNGNYPSFNSVLQMAPFLNGGLFNKDQDLDNLDFKLEDSYFERIFEFLESYNFTIHESTPLDQDLAIDPEMLGNIYEMLVNVTEQSDERHEAGIFYTPKVEIELMLRRTLVEFLHKKTKVNKESLYKFVFKELGEEEVPEFSKQERESLKKELDEITIVDPACGSGHYLVVASQILYELKQLLDEQEGRLTNKFEAKKQIIENSIFGVDIKQWATEIAKLRLWLDLFVDAEDEQLQSPVPLLPSLSFKIRVGDSLVQEIGGHYFKISQSQGIRSAGIRGLLEQVKKLKRDFYENKEHNEAYIKGRELKLYGDIIDQKIRECEKELSGFNAEKGYTSQTFEMFEQGPKQQELPLKAKKQIEKLENEIRALKEQKQKISFKSNFAFWPIEFADIFSDKGGFDIVIANPPYVRQEKIGDPTIEKVQLVEQRREYKNKLERQLQYDWNDKQLKIDKKSDLYVYFYLKGLKLLNPEGVMCFISSNSWLDVGYGAGLQERLLKRVPVVSIYDNQAKRSFKHADVNTVIVILGAPVKNDWDDGLANNNIDFVMFKKPFEAVIYSDIFIDIEKAARRQENEYFKVFPISQRDLWLDGAELVEEKKGQAKMGGKSAHTGTYIGNKWGGKYLRAPEIYWKILEKAGDKLVRLGDIADVRFGIKTGCNEFFYLEDITDMVKDE